MFKFSSLIKVAVLSALAAPVALASDSSIVGSALAEPIYLSICGVILLVFGMMKNKNTDA